MPTLKDVAQAAGVHVSTASLVLNDSFTNTRVSDSTRERILHHAKRMGYRRNHLAHALRTQRTGTVGFVGGDVRNPFFAELVAALREELLRGAHPMELDVMAAPSAGGKGLEEYFHKQLFDGLLVWSEALPARDWPVLENLREPVLPVGLKIPGRRGLWLDLEPGYRELARRLTDFQPARLVFFGPRESVESASPTNRLEIFRAIAGEAGLPEVEPRPYAGADWDAATALRAAKGLEDLGARDAVVCFNDVACLGAVLGGIRERVGRLVGFDGSRLIRSPEMTLSYIDLSIAELAARAAEALRDLLPKRGQPAELPDLPPHKAHFVARNISQS